MRDWQRDAPEWIERIHKSMPAASPDELRKELRKASKAFSCGTSWGARVWSKHCKIYLSRLAGGSAKAAAVQWRDDICFPFRKAEP